MEKYKSTYPTLRQAKTRWSKPSIVSKQGEGPSHDWLDMLRKDARAKLAASIRDSKLGHVREDKVVVFQHDTQLKNVRMKELGVKLKKKRKDPRPADFSRPDLKEDKVGKPSPSVNDIASKHKIPMSAVLAQLAKGIDVEKEHTKDEAEAAEIARDHMHEFPDYYDRLDKMEKSAKKDMKEAVKVRRPPRKKQSRKSWQAYARKLNKDDPKAVRKALLAHSKLTENWNPEVEQIRNTIEAHKQIAVKMAHQHGEQSQEAAFHRAYVNHLKKQLNQVHGLDEDVANSVGGGMSPVVGGEGNIKGVDPIMGKTSRRKKFAGKQVFVVDPTTYHKAYLGKRKYEHYEKYLEGCDIAEEIREYGRKNWDEPIIIENEQTGAMVYLKYGSK